MRQKKLAQPKTEFTFHGHHMVLRASCSSIGHRYECECGAVCDRGQPIWRNWNGPRALRQCPNTITNAPASQFEPLSGSAPCPPTSDAAEVVITKNSGFWCTMFGSHKSPILDEDKKPFPDRDDPIMVAKYLASHARGSINVIWW